MYRYVAKVIDMELHRLKTTMIKDPTKTSKSKHKKYIKPANNKYRKCLFHWSSKEVVKHNHQTHTKWSHTQHDNALYLYEGHPDNIREDIDPHIYDRERKTNCSMVYTTNKITQMFQRFPLWNGRLQTLLQCFYAHRTIIDLLNADL